MNLKKSLNICFVSALAYGLFNPEYKQTYGGSEVQSYLLAKELAKNENYKVNFVVGDFGQNKKEKYGNIDVYRAYPLEKKLINYIKTPFILYRTLKKIGPDIVIQRSAAPETGICAFYCKRNNREFIYSVAHEMDVTGEFASRGIFGKMFNYGIENADFIVLQNREQKKQLEHWKGKNFIKKTKIIKSGYEIENVSTNRKDFIFWVGRSDSWKRPEIFLELAKSFPKEKFVMIMPKSSQKNFWREISKKARKIKNLKFIEKVPFKNIDNYFKKAKIFVNTSKYEGFPNTFIQACKNRTPIISLNINPNNFLDKYECGYYCKNNFEIMKKSTKKLLENEELYEKFSKNAFNYAKKEHDIKKIIKEWEKIL